MKKLLSLALVLALMLSLGVSAFAEVLVNGDSRGQIVSVDSAQYVSASASGDKLTVTGDVTGDVNREHNSVIAENGAEITVGGEVTAELVWPGSAIQASNASTKVTVEGAVTEKTNANAINASFGAAVEVGSVDEKNDGDAINAQSGATVEIDKDVTESGQGFAINALSGANVIVHGDITEDGNGHAINAEGGATVTVEGNITEKGEDSAIRAMSGATVIVFGNVEENDYGVSIACGDATIMVGGDVTKVGGGTAISANNGATVIVEGIVSGDTRNNGGTLGAADLYLGQLYGTIIEKDSDLNRIFYLIRLDDASTKDYAIGENTLFVADKKQEGASGKIYNYTSAAGLTDKYITLTSKVDGKTLSIENLPAGIEKSEKDGVLTLKLTGDFKGGLQNLKLVLVGPPTPGPDPTPIYYVVPVGTVTTASITLPDGIEEGLIKVLDSADHAGLTIDKSLLAEGYDHSVKVTLNGEELPEGAYRFVINWDGSLSLILSTTYMKSLGNGSYDFLAAIDGLEIPFTVAVAE